MPAQRSARASARWPKERLGSTNASTATTAAAATCRGADTEAWGSAPALYRWPGERPGETQHDARARQKRCAKRRAPEDGLPVPASTAAPRPTTATGSIGYCDGCPAWGSAPAATNCLGNCPGLNHSCALRRARYFGSLGLRFTDVGRRAAARCAAGDHLPNADRSRPVGPCRAGRDRLHSARGPESVTERGAAPPPTGRREGYPGTSWRDRA